MESKYQSAIDKLRENQKKQNKTKTVDGKYQDSRYSSAYEKLGKFVSSETQKKAQDKIDSVAQQPIFERIPVAEKYKNSLNTHRVESEQDNNTIELSPEYSETRKNQQSAEASARQGIQQKLLEQKKQERLAQDIENAKEEQTAQKTSGNKVIDAINYINARGADAIANWNDELLLAGDKLLASIKAAVKSVGGYNKPTYQTTPTWTEEKNNAEKAVEKVENIVKDVDKAQTQELENWAKDDSAYKRAEATESQYEDVANNRFVKGAGDTAAAISYMLPTMAANLASGGVLSAPIMAEFGANNAYKEARAEGASINDAKSYALLEGINQGVGDMLIGGLAGTGEGLISKGLNKVTGGKLNSLMSKAMGKLVTSPAGKTAIKYFGNALGEGVEESLQSVVTTLNKNVTFDKDAKVNWGDVAYEGLIGGLMGGVFAASQIPSNYQAYKSDADIVNAFAQAVEKIETTDDVSAVRELGEFISQQMEETINDKSADDEVKERAKFIKAGVDSVNETIDRQADEIVKVNNEVSTAVDAIADSPAKDVVKNTARLVDTVSDIIEPDKDAVNATIDVIRDKIIDANEKINTATTEAEKREATIEKAVYTEIDNTLRNNRSDVETARTELEENNLTVEPGDATIKVPEANSNYDITLQHVVQKHTKTGEDLHVVKIPSRIDKAEYNEIKTQIKKIGGYYSSYAKGFIVPAESIDKIADNLAEINVGVNISDANIDNTATDNAQATTGTATLKMPDGLNASDKTKFTRAFKKWAENEYVNITDMSSAKAHMFASFASKLYEAGYNGIKKVGNYAKLTEAELIEFPVFLQDVFYSLGSTASEGKPYSVQGATEETKPTSSQESTTMDNAPQTNADELEKGENIPDSNIKLDKDGDAQNAERVDIPEVKIADYVADLLAKGESINSKDLQTVANKAFGGTQAEGAYDAHAMTDAMELGVNKYLLSMVEENIDTFNSDNASNAIDSIYKITDEVLLKLPTQTKRSDEQVSLQQFSTPPNIAYTAAWVANINNSDVALEPSAGIGGLATFAKAFGAETVVNELSERRLSVIKNMPFDAFYNENAEQIDNILPDDVKPTVVIMNPPFSSTGGRIKNSTKNAIPHIEQALLRLEDGGRLVAIVGRGMADDTPTFKNWWNQLREEYNIRANVGISGENYRKYGTTFDVQLVVIDKTGPQTGETITGFYDDLYDIPTILEGVRNDRTRKSETDREVEPNKTVTGSKETGVKAVSGGTRPDSDGSSRGISGRNDTTRTAGNMEKSNGDSTRSVGDSSENMVGGYSLQPESDIRVSDNDRGGGRLDRTDDAEVSTEQGSGRMGAGDSGTGNAGLSGGVVQSESVTETPKKRNNKKAAENDDGVYAEYKTAPLTVKGAKKHPAKIVESSAMSAVSSPTLTYKPKIDQSLITNGELSDVQLESISYAGQSHNKILKNGQRRGFFIGDGTGLGKGREIAGMILDNWNQGRKKAIWISEKHDLLTDAKRDWADLGGDPNQMIDWTKAINSKKGLPDEGILFITYDSLKVGPTKKRSDSVVDLVKKWFGEKYDGVIAFDEAHNMGNLIPMKGSRGKKKPSQKAIAGDKLQQVLPNARVAYVSATGATNIENLSYASRLGLWGEGTSFRDTTDFITKIGRSGIAAMELVARDMKAMGVYLARSISYDGVVYDNIQHKLSPVQRKMYDGMSEGWQIVLQNFDKAMQVTNSENAKTVRDRRGQIYTNMQQFYNQVLTSMAMPTVIKDIEKQLASDKSCVIQLVNTNEAAQDRAVSDAKSEGKSDLDDLDITPRQLLVGYVENAFPVNQYEEYIDDNGNIASRVVVDSTGQPVVNRQAVRMKEELIAKLNEISIPEGPLDMLLNHFGADQIAEITGRSGRVLTVVDENGNEHKQYIKRDSKTANIAETKDFQDGKKRILVFSSAGSTGRSFHADKRAKNQQQRIHYVLQPGWEASKAVQGFGRTHRSNQVNTPVFRLVSTDVMGHKRFVTSIARRLDQLGALTKGQRQTGSGVFGEKDNLESPLSRQALREFYRRLGANRLPDLDARSVLGKMGLEKAFYDEFNSFKLNEEIASDITKFLNRILALPVEEQNEVFTAFEEIRDSMYQQALESGELDTGLENVKADKIEITQDDVIYTEPTTGAETRYVKAKLYTKPRIISTVEDAEVYRDRFQGLYRMENGSVRAVYRIADRSDQWGRVFKNYVLISPNTGVQSRYIETTLAAKTQAIPKSEWEAAWAEELAKVPEYNESDKHMITGAILPVWNKLPESDNVKAQRIIAEDGTQYLGRIIQPDMVDSTLRSFDVKAQKDTQNGNTIYDAIYNKNNIVTMRGLYGGTITISKRRVSNENRIEISGSNVQYISERFPGVFSETIQYQRRHFIPTGDKGIKILDDMVKELGVRSVESEDSGGAYYSLGTSRGKWGKGDSKAPVMSINELTKQATRIFGIEINTGKIGNKNASGVFKTHANTIRTRVYGDLPTIAHELGHMFDKKYNLQGNPHIESLVNSFASDLEAAGYTEAQFASESIAEYFSEYMTDREATERKFKAFTEWMYSTISTTDEKKLIDYSGMTNAYFNADLERRADAQIHTRVKDNTAFAQAQMQVDTFLKNPQAYSGNLARKFARWFVDDIVDLKNFGKSYDLAMLEKQADSVTIGRLESAMTDRYGNIVGDSLATILANGSINELNRHAFDKYLVACVALDRIEAAENAKEGESVGSLVYGDERLQNKDSIVERIETYERENPTFHDAAEQIYEYNRNLLQLAVQSGLMSQSLVDALNERYPHYVPLYRVMDDTKNKSPKAKRGYADQKTPIARFKGSGRDIYSPIENIILNTEKFTKACMRNDVMTAFADYIDFNEDMGWAAEKITERKFLDRVSTNDIVEKLMGFSSEKLDSLSEQEAGELITEIIDFVGDYASQWKPAAYQGKNVVSVMRDGKRSYYEVHDADLLKCLTNLNNQQMNFIIKALGGATSAFKVLTTGSNPIFGVTNVQRDVLSGYVSSTTTNNPIAYAKDYAVGLYEAIRKTENYKKYLREGGGYSDAVSRDTSRLRKTEAELVKTTNNLKRFAQILGDIVPRLVESGESASRYAEYKRAREQGIEALEAVRLSQEVTVNFARGGTVVKEIDKFIPYFRASINSMYHLVDVLSTGDKKTKAARWAKFVGANTAPAILALVWRTIASAVFGEDEEKVEDSYQTLSAYNKNAYWCYYVGNGQFFRVAKPKDMTVLSTVWERLVEFGLMGEKDALYGLGEYIVDSLCPTTDIMLISTAIDLAKNETYTGSPIVPQSYENLAPELQYKDDTSKVSIALGDLLGVSPMKLDYILEDNTGFVGQLITNLLRNDGKMNFGFANKFVVDSVYSTDVANIFYDTKEKYDSNAASYKHTLGKDSRYSIADVYGSYKYGKIASTYSDLNSRLKAEPNKDEQRTLKDKMNAFLDAINNTEMSDLDKAVIDIAEIAGADISDIAPYVVVPDSVTYSNNGYKEKFNLTFDEMLNYYVESQVIMNAYYSAILESGYGEEMMAEAMIAVKKEVSQQLRDRWEAIKFNQKYN